MTTVENFHSRPRVDEQRLPRAPLETAVAPAQLGEVLESLHAAKVLTSYVLDPEWVTIRGDLAALQAAVDVGQGLSAMPPTSESTTERATYFAACRAYAHTRAFRRLPEADRAIWHLHASGPPRGVICWALGLSDKTVRWTVERLRVAAGLPRVVSLLGHGKRREKRQTCAASDCISPVKAKGYCLKHYCQEWRRVSGAKRPAPSSVGATSTDAPSRSPSAQH